MKVGYIFLSSQSLTEAAQRAALEREGVARGKVYLDKGDRAERAAMLDADNGVRAGDVVVIASPGVLGGRVDDLRKACATLGARGAAVQVAGEAPILFDASALAAGDFFERARRDKAAARGKALGGASKGGGNPGRWKPTAAELTALRRMWRGGSPEVDVCAEADRLQALRQPDAPPARVTRAMLNFKLGPRGTRGKPGAPR